MLNFPIKTNKQKVGKMGEDAACMFLVKHAYDIVERNYLKKWGEIDIVAEKSGIIHFVEVKTVSRENIRDVSRETLDSYNRPEDNLHPWKLKRLSRVIQTYLLKKCGDDQKWQFDVIVVYLDVKNREARCCFMENIIL